MVLMMIKVMIFGHKARKETKESIRGAPEVTCTISRDKCPLTKRDSVDLDAKPDVEPLKPPKTTGILSSKLLFSLLC